MRSKYVGIYQLISERIRKLTGDHPTIIIADTSDTLSDIIDLAKGGTGVVWSPRSNIALYGFTASAAASEASFNRRLTSTWLAR